MDYTATVVGLGKLGLPVAVRMAESATVIGFDIDPVRVDSVARGQEPFPGEAELAERLAAVVERDALSATIDAATAVTASNVVIVTVPLLDDAGAPDYRHIDEAVADISPHLRPGCLVVFETTLPVGVTRERLAPALCSPQGLTIGDDLFVAHSPERVTTGRVFQDLRRYPKLVGGVTTGCGQRAAAFYQHVLEFDPRPDLDRENGVWLLGSSDAAEFAKLAETTYRNVNIALANEFALFAQDNGMDAYSVIEAANSQPFSHIHQPGASVGGHCIPVYPHLYLAGDPDSAMPRAGTQVNESMPARVVEMLDSMEPGWLDGATIAVLGLAYRPAVKAADRSGTFDLVAELERCGAHAVVHDPLFSNNEISALGLRPMEGTEPTGAIAHTAHADYKQLCQDDIPSVRRMVDGRNCLDPELWPDIQILRLGVAPK